MSTDNVELSNQLFLKTKDSDTLIKHDKTIKIQILYLLTI